MPRVLICTFFALSSIFTNAQIDSVGSGRAMVFDGVNDVITLGNIYDDLLLPFSISAWIYFPAGSNGGPVFVSQDNDPVYNGFWFFVRPTTVFIEYGDGLGENLPNYRRGKSATIPETTQRWMHVCAIITGVNDIQLFVNGINVGGNYTGGSSLPMASQFPNDVAKIGYFLSNGVTYRFQGILDHIQIFNRALSSEEIQRNMTRKIRENESGLIGHWTFDETNGNSIVDRSSKNFDGTVAGNPSRIFSGAPIGNENTFLYSNTWSGKTVQLDDQSVTGITGNPQGTHLYKVKSMPSQTSGLGSVQTDHYYGIFIADIDVNYSYSFGTSLGSSCKVFRRRDNSISTWVESTQLVGTGESTEYFVTAPGASFGIELGDNKVLCDVNSYSLETGLADISDKTFQWNTGATSSSIQVTKSGIYSVIVSAGCFAKKDSISINFLQTPQAFTLGEDEVGCEAVKLLNPLIQGEFDFTWQDGSTSPDFSVTQHGTYWLKVENACGSAADTIRFTKPNPEFMTPNVITANGDAFNQNFVIQPLLSTVYFSVYNRWGQLVYRSDNYKNDWSGSDLPVGIYYYTIDILCVGFKKGMVSIIR